MRPATVDAFIRFFVAAVFLLMSRAVPTAAQEDSPPERLILAFYYATHDWATWTESLCDQPQTLYVSADAGAVDRHLSQARSVGIDALVQAWYGPDLADNPTEPNLTMLLAQAGGTGVAIGALVDMTSDDHLTTGRAVSEALVYLREEHQTRPAYLRFDGRPVVFFLGQSRLSLASWEAVRNQVDADRSMIWIAEAGDAAALDVFDGLHLYRLTGPAANNTLSPLQLSRWSSEVRRWRADNGVTRYWVATVYPGFDESYVTEEEDEDLITVIARRSGDTYSDSWANADSSSPDWIAIRSYNEWPLCTHIEPSIRYDDTYLMLTDDLIERYRRPATPTPTASPTAAAAETPTLVATSTPTATLATAAPSATPEPSPTVTPTVTLTPSATPFRLATPTPTSLPAAEQTIESPASPIPGDPSVPLATAAPGSTSTPTPMPRLPVEGGSRRTCTALPLGLTVAVVLACRRRSAAGR